MMCRTLGSIAVLAATFFAGTQFMNAQPPQKGDPQSRPASQPAAKPAFETIEKRASYMFGSNVGASFKQLTDMGFKLDRAVFNEALEDVLQSREPKMNKEQLAATGMEFQQHLQGLQAKKAEESKIIGDKFVEDMGKKEGVVSLPSGLRYEIIRAGEGERPAATSRVKVHYRGTLIDGEEFDSSYSRGTPSEFGLNQVIKGWTEGLALMKVGAHWKFYIPSDLAYGAGGKGNIGPHSALIFEVELLEILQTPAKGKKK